MKEGSNHHSIASLLRGCGKFQKLFMNSHKRGVVISGLLIFFLSLIAFSILVSCDTTPEPVLILPTQTPKSVKIMFPIIYLASTPTALLPDVAPIVETKLTQAETTTPTPIQTSEVKEDPVEDNCANGCTNQKEGCDIKGNISFTTGEKIYHVPGGAFYEDTVINSENGERWFCTEAEAIANGWRKSKR